MIFPEVDLLLEHAGHKVQVQGGGPEYVVRFPSLFSAIHYALTLWRFRGRAPQGLTLLLEWSAFKYRIRT